MNSRIFSNLTPSKVFPIPSCQLHQFLDFMLCLTVHIQSTTISCWLYIQNIFRIPPFPTTSTYTCLIWATIMLSLSLNSCSSLILQMPLCSSQFSSQWNTYKINLITLLLSTPGGSWFYLDKISVNGLWALLPSVPSSYYLPPHFFLSNLCSYTFLLWTPHKLVHLAIPLSHSHLLLLPLLHGYFLFSF